MVSSFLLVASFGAGALSAPLAPGSSLPTRDLPVGVAGQRRFGAGLGGAHHPALRIEGLGAALDPVEVEFRIDLDAGPARPDDAGDHVLDLAAQAPLQGDLPVLEAAGGIGLGAPGAVRQQPAALVDDRDALGLQALDRGGGEVADRPDLPGIEVAHQLQHDGGARGLAVALEQAALGQDEVDARRLDPADRPDRAGELALQGAQVVHVLDEVGGRERVALVEDLVADAAPAPAGPCRRGPCAAWRGRAGAP